MRRDARADRCGLWKFTAVTAYVTVATAKGSAKFAFSFLFRPTTIRAYYRVCKRSYIVLE